jgi:hypothetical protein
MSQDSASAVSEGVFVSRHAAGMTWLSCDCLYVHSLLCRTTSLCYDDQFRCHFWIYQLYCDLLLRSISRLTESVQVDEQYLISQLMTSCCACVLTCTLRRCAERTTATQRNGVTACEQQSICDGLQHSR